MSDGKSNRFSYFLRFRSNPQTLERVRSSVLELANRLKLSNAFVDDLVLAIYEACANVMEHAYGGKEGGQIYLCITLENELVEVVILDRGNSFEPTEQPNYDPQTIYDAGQDGGMGIALMRTLMDSVEYRVREGGINMIRMTKNVNVKEPATPTSMN